MIAFTFEKVYPNEGRNPFYIAERVSKKNLSLNSNLFIGLISYYCITTFEQQKPYTAYTCKKCQERGTICPGSSLLPVLQSHVQSLHPHVW
jgi:hypothetical protein